MELKSQAFTKFAIFDSNQIVYLSLRMGGGGVFAYKYCKREEGGVAYPDTFPATASLPGVVDKKTTQGHYQGHLWHSAFRFYTIEVKRQIVRGPAEYDRVSQS